ncbi:MAG: class I SAM-dependent methyltransferase family protein [Vicinamibacterales bacterium]
MVNPGAQKKNVTRRSPSIPRRLVREGALHLVPVYYVLRLSDLAREGIEHSGSYRFADHIYRGTPSGRTAVGRWIDRRLLDMPAARAFRRRCQQAQDVVRRALEAIPAGGGPLRVLAVPCGIPRDILEHARTSRLQYPGLLERLEYLGFDIDPQVLDTASALTRAAGLAAAHYHQGNALVREDYPVSRFHVVISTGLGEFLRDDELAAFYAIVYELLERGGTFFTSATARDRRSDALLRMAEIVTHYRCADDLERILRRHSWSRLDLTVDRTGLQTFVTATK